MAAILDFGASITKWKIDIFWGFFAPIDWTTGRPHLIFKVNHENLYCHYPSLLFKRKYWIVGDRHCYKLNIRKIEYSFGKTTWQSIHQYKHDLYTLELEWRRPKIDAQIIFLYWVYYGNVKGALNVKAINYFDDSKSEAYFKSNLQSLVPWTRYALWVECPPHICGYMQSILSDTYN